MLMYRCKGARKWSVPPLSFSGRRERYYEEYLDGLRLWNGIRIVLDEHSIASGNNLAYPTPKGDMSGTSEQSVYAPDVRFRIPIFCYKN